MKREMSYPIRQSAFSDGRLAAGPAARSPVNRRRHRGVTVSAYDLEQMDEDRNLSIVGAFYMFMFGFGCGIFWTVMLTWLF